jgi:hypothetical protein
MKALCYFFSTFFFATFLNAQTRSILTEIHINEFAYKEDTLKLSTPKLISINKFGCSDIISLGRIKTKEFAIQIESFISQLGKSERLVIGKLFYVKKLSAWEKLSEPEYIEVDYNTQVNGKSNSKYDFAFSAYSDGNAEFYIAYLERHTLIK